MLKNKYFKPTISTTPNGISKVRRRNLREFFKMMQKPPMEDGNEGKEFKPDDQDGQLIYNTPDGLEEDPEILRHVELPLNKFIHFLNSSLSLILIHFNFLILLMTLDLSYFSTILPETRNILGPFTIR